MSSVSQLTFPSRTRSGVKEEVRAQHKENLKLRVPKTCHDQSAEYADEAHALNPNKFL
jgi:hypothetical protein